MLLHDLLSNRRDDLIARCRTMSQSRTTPQLPVAEVAHGVPVFIDQLIETLRFERTSNPDIGASAAKHGKELLSHGFTVSQVVHDYGNVCQAVTQMAVELNTPISSRSVRSIRPSSSTPTGS